MLHLAAELGHLAVVQVLIANGAQIDAHKYRTLGTALHCASWNGHLQVVEVLLNSGADPNQVSFDNRTPLHYAAGNQHADVCELLIRRGVNVDAINAQGYTALAYIRDRAVAARLLTLAHEMLDPDEGMLLDQNVNP